MLKSGERTAQQLSQELGVSVWSLKRWSKEVWIGEQTGPGALRLSEPTSALEIARLRRELEFITRQRDILKKALGTVSVAEGNTERRDKASAYSALRGLRPWHVGTLFAREPGDLLLGRFSCRRAVRVGKTRSRSR